MILLGFLKFFFVHFMFYYFWGFFKFYIKTSGLRCGRGRCLINNATPSATDSFATRTHQEDEGANNALIQDNQEQNLSSM